MGRLWNPFHPQIALTGCNSDRGVGLMEKPTPQIDEGREIAWKGPGRRSRKAAPVQSPEQERNPAGEERRASCPADARKGFREGAVLSGGQVYLTKGRGDPMEMTAKAATTEDPAVRTERFGALEGGTPSTRESESEPTERVHGRGV